MIQKGDYMDYLSREPAWFLSQSGASAFNSKTNLEEKTLFIYAYLRKCLHESYDKDKTCFHFALFLADAIHNSQLPYGSYPALIDPTQNPYLAFLIQWGKHPGERILYYGFMSILHQIADPMDPGNWVYDKTCIGTEALAAKLVELEHNFYDERPVDLPHPGVFDIEEPLQSVQLKLMWFFNKR